VPGKKAERYGPFAGGEDLSKEQTAVKENMELPEVGDIKPGKLGESDNKIYQSKPGARAKTKIESGKFRKPVEESSSERQPIPVEYDGLF